MTDSRFLDAGTASALARETARLDRLTADTGEDVAFLAAAVESIEEPTDYADLPPAVEAAFHRVEARHGAAALGAVKKRLVLALMAGMGRRIAAKGLPESVLARYPEVLAVLAAEILDVADADYLPGIDAIRDLRLAAVRSLPCGAQLVDESYIPEAYLEHEGFAAFVRERLGALSPVYRIHTDTRMLAEFDAPGWRRCYRRIAELLDRNPRIRGVVGVSWFFDPQLEAISPHLAYLRHIPLDGGAVLQREGPGASHTARATETSRSRRAAFRRGDYLPTGYAIVWARGDLLRWAALTQREAGSPSQ